MKDYGFILLSRKIYESDPFWLEDRPRTRYEAWEDLIQRAAFAPHCRATGGSHVELQRGEVLGSLRFLATQWKWSVKQTRTYLSTLQRMGRVVRRVETPHGTIWFLPNYDAYQTRDETGTGRGTRRNGETTPMPLRVTGASGTASDTPGAQVGHSEGTARAQRETRGKKGKEGSPSAARKRREALPEGWSPNDQHRAMARELRLNLDDAAAGFRDHAAANGRVQIDWDASFRNWLRRAREIKDEQAKKAGTRTTEYPRESRTLESVDPFTEKARAEATRRRESIRAFAADNPDLADTAREEAAAEVAIEMPTARRDAQLQETAKRYEAKIEALIAKGRAA